MEAEPKAGRVCTFDRGFERTPIHSWRALGNRPKEDAALVSELQDRTKTLMLELERSRAFARIFLSSEAVKAIDEFEQVVKGCKPADSIQFFSQATEQLIAAAKQELRV